MHNSKEDLDRFYANNPDYYKSRSSTITIPAHGIIPAVYSIETGDYYNRPSECPEEPSGIQKSMKIAFVLLVLTLLLIGFVFAILSVTRLSKA